MAKALTLAAAVVTLMLTASCSSPSGKALSMQRKTDEMQKGAITMQIKADPQLNRYGKNAHTLFLCLYQLTSPNAFNQLAQEKDGLSRLMECGRFDASVASARQLVVQPGQELKEVRDRAEGARYLGIATGYFGTGKEKVTELLPLPAGSGDQIVLELGTYQISNAKVK